MEVLQESDVRQIYFKQGLTRLVVAEDAYITQQARDFIREKGMTLVLEHDRTESPYAASPDKKECLPVGAGRGQESRKECLPTLSDRIPENREIQPAREMAQGHFVTEDGRRLEKKPEYMTHLYGNVLVPKNHPRIILRGRLDSLEAEIILVQIRARLGGQETLAEELGELLDFCRKLLSCEVTGKELPEWKLLGMDETQLRLCSQQPMGYLGTGHILPDCRLGEIAGGLNLLRGHSREVELAALDAFMRDDGQADREDIIQGLNRLSSAFYILMLRQVVKNK